MLRLFQLFRRKVREVVKPAPLVFPLLHEYPMQPMQGNDAFLFAQVPHLRPDVVAMMCMDMRAAWCTKILDKRLQFAEVYDLIDPRVLLLAYTLAKTPGLATLWAYTLTRMAKERQTELLYWAEFVEAFPCKEPTPAAYQQAWIAQKAGMVNLLDKPEQWQ